MKNVCLIFAFSFCFLGQVDSQDYALEGTVSDSLDKSLELATAILMHKADSVMAGFSITNPKGRFKIDGLSPGEYILTINFLGYQDFNQSVTLERDTDLGVFILVPESENLQPVTVSATHIPIQIKKDTIQYNADAYKVRPMDNVEELLKKLPGIEVEDDGTIKAHGEEVENVFVEGKEFFGNDPTIATKNLPADVVDNVQVYDKLSDMAEFSGIDDGEREKTINLVLKEGKKAGYFGNASGGYGTEQRYEGKFNVNRFTASTQLSAIGMINNVNKQGFSFREYIDFMGGLSNLMSGGGRFRDSGGIPIARGLGDGFVQTGAGGLNYNIDLNDNLKVYSSYFYKRIKNDIRQTTKSQNLLERNTFDTEQFSDLTNINKSHSLNSTIRANMDSTQSVIARITLGWNDGTSESFSDTKNYTPQGELQSGGIYDNASTGERLNGNVNLTYMKKMYKKGRFFSGNIRVGITDDDKISDLNSVNLFRLNGGVSEDTLLQEQIQTNDQHNYLLKLSLTEPLGKRRYLEVNFSRSNYNNDFSKNFYDLLGQRRTDPVLNEQLSNQYVRDYSYNRAGVNLKFNSNSSSLTTGVSLQHADLNGTLQNEEIEINQDYVYFLPNLFWNKDISASRSLRVRYSTAINEPSLEQLQPIVDNSDPLNVYIGNPELRPAYRHNLNINYNSYSQFSNTGFFTYLNARYTKNNITNTRTVDDLFVQTTKPINTDYAFNSSLYMNFNAPLKFIKQRINISNSMTFSDNILFVNSTENKVKRVNNRISLSLENWNNDLIDIEVGTNVGLNSTAYSQNSDQNQAYFDSEYFLSFDLDLKGDWNFNTYFRHTIYSEEDFGERLSISRWEASVSKVFGAAKKVRVELAALDILDQNQNINRSTNLNYIQETLTETIGRYFIARVAYSFNGFGQKSWFGGGKGKGRRWK